MMQSNERDGGNASLYFAPPPSSCAAMVCLGFAILVAGVAGCGSSYPSVTGKVTLDGAPLTAGTMAFHPPNTAGVGYATIQSDGSFAARTGGQTGLAPGKYKVTVTAVPTLAPPTKENPIPQAKSTVPAKYADVKTTDLEIEVTEKGDNNFPLALKN